MEKVHNNEPFSKQITIIVGLTVVGTMAFGLALSFYRNLLFEENLKELEGRNQKLVNEIERGYRELDYFRSEQYKDKFAKEKLGKVNPEEKVLIILQPPTDIQSNPTTMSTEEQQKILYEEFLRQTPVIEHWRLYLFHHEKIRQLE